MHVLLALVLMAGLLPGYYALREPSKNELNLTAGVGDTLRLHYDVTPLSENIHSCILKQSYDYSCGSAALGTILNNYLGENFTEKQIITGLMAYGDKEQIKKLRAFSFFDMQKFVQALGYKCGGYTADLSDLEKPDLWPCIVPVEIFDYHHFVVVKGIYKNHVFVSDPWRGNNSYTINQFNKMWYKKVLFILYPNTSPPLTCLKLKVADLRFIDQDMEKTLMFDIDQPFNLPKEWEANFFNPAETVRRYKH